MDRSLLTSEELSEVLRRAQEIDAVSGDASELEQYVKAAEEAGISRDATLQALRERLGYPAIAAKEGELVLAQSADGHFYAAKVLTVEERGATVRFLNGGQATLPLTDLRSLTLTPGQRMNYHSPSMSMWVNGTVRKYNPDSLTVEIDNWGSVETVSLEKVRMLDRHARPNLKQTANLWAMRLWWLAGGLGLGLIIERLLIR